MSHYGPERMTVDSRNHAYHPYGSNIFHTPMQLYMKESQCAATEQYDIMSAVTRRHNNQKKTVLDVHNPRCHSFDSKVNPHRSSNILLIFHHVIWFKASSIFSHQLPGYFVDSVPPAVVVKRFNKQSANPTPQLGVPISCGCNKSIFRTFRREGGKQRCIRGHRRISFACASNSN